MVVTRKKMYFDRLLPIYRELKRKESHMGADMEPFAMPLFSTNPMKRYVVLVKYRKITEYLQQNATGEIALDFGTGFGAFLPVLSGLFKKVIALDAFEDQIVAASNLVSFMHLSNVKIKKVEKEDGLSQFQDGQFDVVLATDVLEHNLNYKSIVMEFKRILKPGGLLVVSLPREHIIYRLFARREVEHNEERGHVYHSSKGADQVDTFISNNFKKIRFDNVYSFIHITYFIRQ